MGIFGNIAWRWIKLSDFKHSVSSQIITGAFKVHLKRIRCLPDLFFYLSKQMNNQ